MDQFQEMLVRHFDARLKETAHDANARLEVLNEKAAAIRAANSPDAKRLLEMEAKLERLKQRSAHLSRAIGKGQLAYATAYDILGDLDRLWVFPVPWAKMSRTQIQYGLIRSIHAQDARLQKELAGFRSELNGAGLCFDHAAGVGELVRSERAVLDMIFCEEEILACARKAIERMRLLLQELQPLLHHLEHLRGEMCAESENLCKQRAALIEQSRIFSAED